MDKEQWLCLRRKFGQSKSVKWVIALGVAGVLLLLLSARAADKKETTPSNGFTVEEYTARLEQRLCDIVGGIEGAGNCRVMITLENGVEYLYATEQKINSSRTEKNDTSGNGVSQADTAQDSVILIDGDGGKQGLLVTEIQPTVKGVVVVCQGGDRPEVQQRITQAVTAVLDLSAARVCVTKLS